MTAYKRYIHDYIALRDDDASDLEFCFNIDVYGNNQSLPKLQFARGIDINAVERIR